MNAPGYLREHPPAPATEIDDPMRAWFADLPGAEFGDVSGRVRVRRGEPAMTNAVPRGSGKPSPRI